SEIADRAVAQFRRDSGLVLGTTTSGVNGISGTTLASQEISQLDGELVTARGARAEAEARLHQAERAMASPSEVNVSNTVIQSPLIQNLTEQKITIQRSLAELASQYGDRHPRMIGLRNDLRDLETRIRAEIAKVVAGLRNEVSVARSREETLS